MRTPAAAKGARSSPSRTRNAILRPAWWRRRRNFVRTMGKKMSGGVPMNAGYPEVSLYVDGGWCQGGGGTSQKVPTPATGDALARAPHAARADPDPAIAAAEKGFTAWRKVSALDRYK